VQAWRPHLFKDIKLLGVQRGATKLVVETRRMGYEEKLNLLGMETLETRRIRGDLIAALKILKGFDYADETRFYVRAEGHTGHSFNTQIFHNWGGDV
jgi:ribonuclease P/MRP protein subunit RPP40